MIARTSFMIISSLLVIGSKPYAQGVYYPLNIGDRWAYTGWLLCSTEVIRDTVMPDGMTYSYLSAGSCPPRFERQMGDTIYSFDNASPKGVIIFDFSRKKGDTIYTRISAPGDTSDYILSWYDTSHVFGRNLRRWIFGWAPRHVIDAWDAYEVTDSLGITNRSQSDYMFSDIEGAIINGIQYGSILSVSQELHELPNQLYIAQNYPNPFNSETEIVYSLPAAAPVRLTVYDVLGRVASETLLGMQSPGSHKTRFDGSLLSSGVYFYRLQAGELTRITSMMVVK